MEKSGVKYNVQTQKSLGVEPSYTKANCTTYSNFPIDCNMMCGVCPYPCDGKQCENGGTWIKTHVNVLVTNLTLVQPVPTRTVVEVKNRGVLVLLRQIVKNTVTSQLIVISCVVYVLKMLISRRELK
ncbi:hypothetical protein LOTGIDRAFT_239623 [Lottia gigantea]|uniref:Uncharacterized protein n=1 Tax=Lottia gigantea TaxID=225164 RepID=V4A4M6_LOTGI|nr:hypothetical protein LOTGIDRAFT_239623 [Lottia gigantea]ESO88221.1 hypothetical protein LOTGIDRAFT_239623 [Lottia gigantea]